MRVPLESYEKDTWIWREDLKVLELIPHSTSSIMSSESGTSHQSYIIIGAGCFGASTALHLKRAFPSAEVSLIDRTPFPCPSAAAHDLNKIVRSDYDDPFYMKLGLEAIELWQNDPIFSPFYHQTGMLWAGDIKMSSKVIKNYQSVTTDFEAELLDPENAKARFGGIFRDTNWAGLEKCLWNPRAGWAEAENALQSCISAALELGVRYVVDSVLFISFDRSNTATGVKLQSGKELVAKNIVLCAGANTAKLLADSAPNTEYFQAGDRMTAAASIMGLFKVPASELTKFESAPVIINSLDHTQGQTLCSFLAFLPTNTFRGKYTSWKSRNY
jgi:sarcosine oxidase / L-pipecolate oxidase